MWIDNSSHHFLMWNRDSEECADELRVRYLSNMLASKTWLLDAERSFTHNFRSHVTNPGLPTDSHLYISAFVVVRGDTLRAMELAAQVDWPVLSRMPVGCVAECELDAFSTLSFLPVKGINASLIALWRRSTPREPKPAASLGAIVAILDAHNVWIRRLRKVGCHLDSGRMNINVDSFYMEAGVTREGRKATGSLMCIGTFALEQISFPDALQRSGLDQPRFVGEISRSNGWWSTRNQPPNLRLLTWGAEAS
jgi:hypothetical protein